MNSYPLNRTKFKAQTATDAAKHSSYYPKIYWQERLKIAYYLNSVAFNCPENRPPKLDRTKFFTNEEIKMSNIFNDDFRDFIPELNSAEVKYILVGGFAVILSGYSRTTGDMDIWVDRTL